MVTSKEKYLKLIKEGVSGFAHTPAMQKTSASFNRCISYIKKDILKTEENESYELLSGRYNVNISRHTFVLTMAAIIFVTLLLALVIWTKVVKIEHKETGILKEKPTEIITKKDEASFTFSKKDLFKRYDAAFDVFDLNLHQETIGIIENCSSSNQMCHIISLYKHITNNFKCIEGDVGAKKLKLPSETWQDKEGSSEDLSIMFSAMLYGFGYEVNILLTPNEAVCAINNFDEAKFMSEVIDKFKTKFSFLKRKKYSLSAYNSYLIDIKEDFRFEPLTFELKSTAPLNIVILNDSYDYGLYKKGESPLIISEYDANNIENYQKDIYIRKGAYIAIEANETPADIIYVGYRKNDNRVVRYIKDVSKIRKNDGSHYFNQTSMLFTLGPEHSIPGREKKYIEALRGAGGIIEIPYHFMAEKFMAKKN